MDLIDKQNIVGFEIRQNGGKIAGARDHRSRGRAKTDAELPRDDLRQRGLTKTGRTVQEDVVERLFTRTGGADEHPQIVANGALADKIPEALRTQGGIGVIFLTDGRNRARGGVISQWGPPVRATKS